ncbi:MAG: hypothetical protein SGJ07_15150 [Rhodospirillaceae bacterium]|nr:hypothetical protein [Rhodospirillaceae bacterium]
MTAKTTGRSGVAPPAKPKAGPERDTRLADALRQNLRRRKAQKSARKSDESVKSGARDKSGGGEG